MHFSRSSYRPARRLSFAGGRGPDHPRAARKHGGKHGATKRRFDDCERSSYIENNMYSLGRQLLRPDYTCGLTIRQQLRKHLGGSDQTVDLIPSVLPFDAAVALEVLVFHRVEPIIPDEREREAGLNEIA